ncbi:MAG TPA: M23 family metallopeptidase [Candidatus Limnocylindria bacterium]|nr:M23 family metallopeptidase [Candidatus Limnocylindria bacterium]
MRTAVVALVVLVFGAVTVALSSGRQGAATPAVVAAAPLATADPAATARTDPDLDRGRLAREDRADRRAVRLRGLRLPIDDATLPTDDRLLPNAERAYRGGWHEGIDFPAPAGTPVRAAAGGTIVRVDRDFSDWGRESEQLALDVAVGLGYTPAATLDRIRGRQVWIDHGHGVVTRYAHLSSVADLSVGDAVAAGDVIGAVGSSGYPEGGPHLHLEVRVGTSYLGDGLSGDALHAAIAAAFD